MATQLNPLVSVITGTYDGADKIVDAIECIRAQTYRPLEHVIVSDGPDAKLSDLICWLQDGSSDVPIVFQELGFQSSHWLTMSRGAMPFQTAQFLARGELQMTLSDDEWAHPTHIQKLYELMEATQSDFTYSRVEFVHGLTGEHSVGGHWPPDTGGITNFLYRRELLDYGMFRPHVGMATDIDQVSSWLAAGAKCAMLDEVTFRHPGSYLDDRTFDVALQPLRGQQGKRILLGQKWKGIPIDMQGKFYRVQT
jgi:hypothetical protein